MLEKVNEKQFRAYGNHMPGPNPSTRLYGGQMILQSYLAAKMVHSKRKIVSKLRVSFHSPGNLTDPLLIDVRIQNPTHLILRQGKIISTAVAKCVSSSRELFRLALEHNNLSNFGSPTDYPPLEYYLSLSSGSSQYVQDSIHEYVERALFETRPESISDFVYLNTKIGFKLRVWCRLHQRFRDNVFEDPLIVPILLSDYLVFNPVNIELYALGFPDGVFAGASMNHEIIVHKVDGFDPLGYFIYELECTVNSQNNVFMQGHIYDESRDCILTFEQQGFVLSKDEALSSKM
ncbi:thioesterase-like superfamily domain-containing protein [Ditylenchus destructor]|uniref:Thioesterase-like superfamily domain-containing protein n=1 Tax=Ditylenchus destructor TaxID=166010 RepID=A0AAD4MT30_9BILA|nr:thioesterase-like superfamily domain-containing protein [Ditylenchus destructor]